MSKGLEDLKDLKNIFIGHCKELKCELNHIKVCENKFDNIEKELKGKEGLEKKVENLEKELGVQSLKEFINILDDTKKFKALDIIKEKRVQVALLFNCKDINEYNWCMYPYKERELTQQEYDLLKEVLL